MIKNMQQLRATVKQMGHIVAALEDMRQNMLENPQLYRVLMEGSVVQLEEMRQEMEEFLSTPENVEIKR